MVRNGTRVRVGVVVPGRAAATWPLAGLRFGDDGFELSVSALMRRAIGTVLQPSCDWRDVESIRRNRFSVAVRLPGRRQVYFTAFFGKRARRFIETGRANGVSIEE